MHPFTIHCNAPLPEAAAALLREEVVPHTLGVPLEEADVSFGQPDVATVIASPRLRWVQLSSAGYTSYDRDDVRVALTRRGAALTKSSAVYDEPCAEQLLAFMLGQARQLPPALANQRDGRAWPQKQMRGRCRLLREQSAVIVG